MLSSRLFWRFFSFFTLVMLLVAALSMRSEQSVLAKQDTRRIHAHLVALQAFSENLLEALYFDDLTEVAQALANNPHFADEVFIYDAWQQALFVEETAWARLRSRFFDVALPVLDAWVNNQENPVIQQNISHANPSLNQNTHFESWYGVNSISGDYYALLLTPRMHYAAWASPRLAGQLLRAVLLLLVVALLCFWLAYGLSRRIRWLQQASQQLAAGHYWRALPYLRAALGKRKRLFYRDELDALSEDFLALHQALLTHKKSQKQLLSDISHELRSPLARMQVMITMAEDNADNPANLEKRIQ